MRYQLPLAAALTLLAPVFGFIGMGIKKYDPTCAVACSSSLLKVKLDCPDSPGAGHHRRSAPAGGITPQCKAQSEPFLTTLAECINSTCYYDVDLWALEKYWAGYSTGSPLAKPKWGYHEALSHVNATPTELFTSNETLRNTRYIGQPLYSLHKTSTDVYVAGEEAHARYA